MTGNKRQGETVYQAGKVLDSKDKSQHDESRPVNPEHQKILEWLKRVKFKRTLVNGVDEEDVWRKLEELNQMYESSLLAEKAVYDARLSDYMASSEAELKRYKLAARTLKSRYDEQLRRNNQLEQQMKVSSGQIDNREDDITGIRKG